MIRPNSPRDAVIYYSFININLVRFIIELLLQLAYPACCGKCAAYKTTNTFHSNDDFFKRVKSPDFNNTNVILPLFGDFSSRLWHGYYFLPLFEVSDAYLVTLPRDSGDLISSLLSGIYTLWPLLLICLLMAACAGFMGWILVSIFGRFILFNENCIRFIIFFLIYTYFP